jgi:hypothetical protein
VIPNTRDLYRCDVCGRLFVMDLDPVTRCATHGENEHCHLGERVMEPGGFAVPAPASPTCIPYAVP